MLPPPVPLPPPFIPPARIMTYAQLEAARAALPSFPQSNLGRPSIVSFSF
jgi:hypothetical protein